jgi:putative YphP/YqiW family bacilliredoxin
MTTATYPADVVMPFKEELTDKGFEDLTTPEQVDEALSRPGTVLMVVNSVCGCAAGTARPGILASLTHGKKPDHLTTVFAGYDMDAVARAREHFLPYPPSSPSIALFKDGEMVHFIERHHIQGRPSELIAQNLVGAYEDFC